ncbi:MAG: cupredoxin domain-containing protein [Methanoregulaceae archaeon]|jgi:plastocyanin
MKIFATTLLIIVIIAVLIAGCSQAPQPQSQTTVVPTVSVESTTLPQITVVPTPISQASVSANTISINNFAFKPQTITVKAGSIVRWENLDPVSHRIMFNDKSVSGSDVLSYSQSFSKKFDQAGSFPYYCSIHPDMTGTVIVQ